MVRFWQVLAFWGGILLVLFLGYHLLNLGVGEPIMVTVLGIAVVLFYFVLRSGLSLQRRVHLDLNSQFDAVLNSAGHEGLRDNLDVLLRKVEEIGWTEETLKGTPAYDKYQNLRKCRELTVTAIDYKVSRRADLDTLRKLKLDLDNIELQLRSLGWSEGGVSVAERLYDARYQYWLRFVAALRIWSGIALPMIVITWLFEATSVVQGRRDPEEVYTVGFFAVACLVSFVIAKVLGLS